MKYKYIIHKNENSVEPIWIEIVSTNMELVSAFVSRINDEWQYLSYTESLQRAINGVSENEKRGDEGVEMETGREYSRIYYIHDDTHICTIETEQLLLLIKTWWKEYLEFNSAKLDRVLMNQREKDAKQIEDQMEEDKRNGAYSKQKHDDLMLELKAKYKMN